MWEIVREAATQTAALVAANERLEIKGPKKKKEASSEQESGACERCKFKAKAAEL